MCVNYTWRRFFVLGTKIRLNCTGLGAKHLNYLKEVKITLGGTTHSKQVSFLFTYFKDYDVVCTKYGISLCNITRRLVIFCQGSTWPRIEPRWWKKAVYFRSTSVVYPKNYQFRGWLTDYYTPNFDSNHKINALKRNRCLNTGVLHLNKFVCP